MDLLSTTTSSEVGVREWIMIANLAITIILSVFVARIRGLETELKQATRQLVDERLSAIQQRQADVDRRLAEGESRFMRLDDRDHTLEVKLLQELRDLTEKVATKADIRSLREELGK